MTAIYLPVEFRAREFDSKLLLAAVLAARGYPVLVGQQWALYANLARLPKGVVLFKSFNKIHQNAMHEARRAGHRVAALEEELLAHMDEKGVRRLCDGGIFEAVDLMLANGDHERDLLRAMSGARVRIETGGNGRVDLLKPQLRALYAPAVEAVRARYGEFVLVNTNFPALHSIWNSMEHVTRLQQEAGVIDPRDPRTLKDWEDYLAFEESNRAGIVAAVRELARRRPRQAIVLRPHPGEDLRHWDGVFDGLGNVSIVREGPHVPWTLGCRLLLHTSCTTGFEAAVAGRPALSLVPRPSWIASSFLSNIVNPVFADPLAMVDAAEAVLEGAAPPAPPSAVEAERYVSNFGDRLGAARIAELLAEGLPAQAQPLKLPRLNVGPLDARLAAKCSIAPLEAEEALGRIAGALALPERPQLQPLAESLFLVAAPALMSQASLPQPAASPDELRRLMEQACEAGEFAKAYEIFKRSFADAHRYGELCYLAGMALLELGKHALALEYLQQAAAAANAVQPEIVFALARAHHRLGQLEEAKRYAEHAWHLAPTAQPIFDFYRELAARGGRAPAHWLVIGCSHVRYFRYLQLNQPRFFGWRLHLECYEFGGATAFGLGHEGSQAGALTATRQLRARLGLAERVVVYFGEIDCRRAAWKAAQTLGRPVEEMIGQSAERLEAYVAKEILPHNRKVLILGAKPQIVADEDFYRNSLEDERTVFQPLAERERITLLYNSLLRRIAEKLRVQYADIDDALAGEKSRRQFFRKAFWDTYTTDTHGNVDYFARLYHQKLAGLL